MTKIKKEHTSQGDEVKRRLGVSGGGVSGVGDGGGGGGGRKPQED